MVEPSRRERQTEAVRQTLRDTHVVAPVEHWKMDLVAAALSHHSPPPFARRPPHSKWDRADREGEEESGEMSSNCQLT